jgi:hypothetical protein
MIYYYNGSLQHLFGLFIHTQICTEKRQYKQYRKLYYNMQFASEQQLYEWTGCLPGTVNI